MADTPARFDPAALAARRPAGRMEAILDDPNPAARVAATPVQELYSLIKDLGIEEASELVALAAPEQVQGFLDLDAWNGDHLDDAATRPWLEALLSASPEQITRVWRGLDAELTALLLVRWTRIYNLAEEEVPDWEEPPFVPTPDRFFMLKITVEDEDAIRLIGTLIDRLYRVDDVLARHTLRAAKSEPPGELEETAYRWRTGRMQDLGFPPIEEALAVYQPLDVASITVGESSAETHVEPLTLPGVYVEPVRRGFLGRVLARITDGVESARLEAALVTLFNRVLGARGVNPSDTVAVAAGAEAGAATLSLGLETVSRGDLARAEETLRTVSLVRLHRAGHSVALQLARLARVLVARAGRAEEPHASVLAALLQTRPAFPRVLETPPTLGTRPFASVADVARVTRALALLGAQLTLVRDVLGVDPAARGKVVTLGDVGRTAVVRIVLGLPPPVTAALTVEDVRRFAAALVAGRVVDTAAIQAEFQRLASAREIATTQEFAVAIAGWIGDLEQELGSLATDSAPDRRFVKGLLLE